MTSSDRTTLVVWNPGAGSAREAADLRAELERAPATRVLEFDERDALDQLRQLDDTTTVIAAGGDGTVHRVLNAIRDQLARITFGVLPLGTGNDLSRSLGMPLDPFEAYLALRANRQRSIDLATVATPSSERLFANMANGGNSNRVSECLTAEMKTRWGAWCYLRGAIGVLADLEGFHVRLRCDGQPDEDHLAWNVMIANGRTVAGGALVAPRANLEDGLLDVIVVLDQSPLDMANLAAEFFLGDYLNDPRVVYRQARDVEVTLRPEANFIVDGEVVTGQPLRFQVRPGALRAIVGPEYISGKPAHESAMAGSVGADRGGMR